MSKSGVTAFLIKEFKEVLPPTVFFAVGFNLLVTWHRFAAIQIWIFVLFLIYTSIGWKAKRFPASERG